MVVTPETLQYMATWTLTPTLQCLLVREAIPQRPLSMDHPYLQDNQSEHSVVTCTHMYVHWILAMQRPNLGPNTVYIHVHVMYMYMYMAQLS